MKLKEPGLGLQPNVNLRALARRSVFDCAPAPGWERRSVQRLLTTADRRVVAILFAIMFIGGADHLVINPTLPQMARDRRIPVELGGLWVTAYALATGIFAVAFGPISDRLGRRVILELGVVAHTLGLVVCGLAPSFEALVIARFVAGAGAGLIVTSNASFVGDHFPPQARAVAMGWVLSGFFSSMILAVPLGAFLSESFGWRNMFFCLGLASAAVGAAAVLYLPRPRFEERTTSLSLQDALRSYGRLLADKRVIGVLLMSASIGLSMTIFSVYTSPWLEATFGMSTLERGLMYMVGGPAVVLGGPLSGALSNRYGRVPVVVAGSALLSIALAFMPFSGAFVSSLEPLGARVPAAFGIWISALPALAIFFIVMGLGSIRAGPFFTLAIEVVPPQSRGAMSALRNAFNQGGAAFGAALGGFLWANLRSPYLAICFMASLIGLLGVAVFFGIGAIADGRLVAIEGEVAKATRGDAARLLGGSGEYAIITASLTAGNMIAWQQAIEKRNAEKHPNLKRVALR
ncbi:MAG: MFS transporter, partial [Myxococcales bacterium]|nr:MFS transporter [Myxococcales bacterium]